MTTKAKVKTKPKVKIDHNKEFIQMRDLYLDMLKKRMSGGRTKKLHTIASYTSTARDFLNFTGKTEKITAMDVDKYLAAQRQEGKSEVTLRTKMTQIKKLNQVCDFFNWTFTRSDLPAPGPDYVAETPTFTPEQVEKLIKAQDKYTPAERFYLATATVYGCRREALSQLSSKVIELEIDEPTITIPGVHGGRTIKHLVPEALLPVFLEYKVKAHSGNALTEMFHRIAEKAGIPLPAARTSQGYGWHSLRRCVNSMAEHFIPKCKDPGGKDPLPQSVWADYTGWSKTRKGATFFGSTMAGHYSHFEVLYKDPYWMDRCIFKGHPFLQMWEEALKPVKKAGK